MTELALLIGGGVAILVGLFLALILFGAILAGAIHQFTFSVEHGGLVGLALYVAAWIFMPVVMLVVSVIGGAFGNLDD